MIGKIKQYLKSPDKEIRKLGIELAINSLTQEEVSSITFDNWGDFLEISFGIDEKLILEHKKLNHDTRRNDTIT